MANIEKQKMTSKELMVQAQKRVRLMVKGGEIVLPADYNPGNALKSFWLKLQTIRNRDKRSALEVCTPTSIMDSMLHMVVMGLTVAKDQGYLIVYGNKLTFQPSYFGWVSIAKRVLNTSHIDAQVVYEDDEFEYEIKEGRKFVTKHVQKFQNIDNNKIVGAYATIVYTDGSKKSEVMTIVELMDSWKKSTNNPINNQGKLSPDSVHSQFKQEMAKKTVLVRATKVDIKSSNDNDVLVNAINKTIEAEYKDPMEGVDDDTGREPFMIDDSPEEAPLKDEKKNGLFAKADKEKTTPGKQLFKTPTAKQKAEQQEIDSVADSVAQISDVQKKMIERLIIFLLDKGVSEKTLMGTIANDYGTNVIDDLTKGEAESLIKSLQKEQQLINS